MEDSEFDIESDVFSQYLHSFDNEISENEKIKQLAKRFNLSEDKVATIVKSDDTKIETKYTESEYLKSLSQKELDSLYAVLARQEKLGRNSNIMNNIELITNERNQSNE
ncbi:MAG: hypothetical protein ACWA45_00445 [Flavobacteriales bacterium]